MQDRDPTEGTGSSEVSCRWMHMHTVQYKHGMVEPRAGCVTAVGVDSSLSLAVGPSC